MKDVLVEHRANVLTVQLNRPDKKNALTGAMYDAISDSLEQAEADPKIRAVSITGSGDSFTAGNDIDDFLNGPSRSGERPAPRFLRVLSSFPKIVVAGVNGLAVGIGTTMLLHCDIVLASENASFRLPFVNLGLVPEAGSSLLLPRLIGYQRTAGMMFCDDALDAKAALSLGLIRSIHPTSELEPAMTTILQKIASKPPRAVRLTKSLLRSETNEAALQMHREMQFFQSQLGSGEASEAMQAFKEKRKPDFSRFQD
ncbi:enoyl-CoA hydratase/carnithine racemase [Bradyrhizobium sp. USDA 4461]